MGAGAGVRPKSIGYLDIIGHSHMAENGATFPDWGAAHKLDGFLQPAVYDSIALGGAIAAYHNSGNAAQGDGGWAHVATEMPRDEIITGYGKTTVTSATIVGATSIPVAERAGFYYGEYIVMGRGTNTESVQISVDPAGVSGPGNLTVTACVNAHAAGDAFYHAPRNQGGYLPRSQLTLVGLGLNDLARFGPYTQGTFGTTAGASRGLTPTMHALRYIFAHVRSAVVFPVTHPTVAITGAWVSFPYADGTKSYPASWGASGQMYYSATPGSTMSFTTAPDFPGGVINFFSMCSGDGSGGLWDVAITGATTYSQTSCHDNRDVNAVTFNDSVALPTGKSTGTVYRTPKLNPGVNLVTMTLSAFAHTAAWALGFGVEAQQLPAILMVHDPRMGQQAYTQFGYYQRRSSVLPAAVATATSGSATVNFPVAFTVGTTATNAAAVFPGDTITLGYGLSTQETRRIITVNSSTQVTVDAAFATTHTAENVNVGMQDADLVGGGYANPNDTQGKISVPGLQAKTRAVMAEFDSWIGEVNLDTAFNPTVLTVDTLNFGSDGIHYNDRGHALAAAEIAKGYYARNWTFTQLAAPSIGMSRTFINVYGDAGATPVTNQTVVFYNGFSNYFPVSNFYAKTGFYKDMRTREIFVRGAVYGGTGNGNIIWQMPRGYRPAAILPFAGFSQVGPVLLEIDSNGYVYVSAGWPGANVGITFAFSFLAEG